MNKVGERLQIHVGLGERSEHHLRVDERLCRGDGVGDHLLLPNDVAARRVDDLDCTILLDQQQLVRLVAISFGDHPVEFLVDADEFEGRDAAGDDRTVEALEVSDFALQRHQRRLRVHVENLPVGAPDDDLLAVARNLLNLELERRLGDRLGEVVGAVAEVDVALRVDRHHLPNVRRLLDVEQIVADEKIFHPRELLAVVLVERVKVDDVPGVLKDGAQHVHRLVMVAVDVHAQHMITHAPSEDDVLVVPVDDDDAFGRSQDQIFCIAGHGAGQDFVVVELFARHRFHLQQQNVQHALLVRHLQNLSLRYAQADLSAGSGARPLVDVERLVQRLPLAVGHQSSVVDQIGESQLAAAVHQHDAVVHRVGHSEDVGEIRVDLHVPVLLESADLPLVELNVPLLCPDDQVNSRRQRFLESIEASRLVADGSRIQALDELVVRLVGNRAMRADHGDFTRPSVAERVDEKFAVAVQGEEAVTAEDLHVGDDDARRFVLVQNGNVGIFLRDVLQQNIVLERHQTVTLVVTALHEAHQVWLRPFRKLHDLRLVLGVVQVVHPHSIAVCLDLLLRHLLHQPAAGQGTLEKAHVTRLEDQLLVVGQEVDQLGQKVEAILVAPGDFVDEPTEIADGVRKLRDSHLLLEEPEVEVQVEQILHLGSHQVVRQEEVEVTVLREVQVELLALPQDFLHFVLGDQVPMVLDLVLLRDVLLQEVEVEKVERADFRRCPIDQRILGELPHRLLHLAHVGVPDFAQHVERNVGVVGEDHHFLVADLLVGAEELKRRLDRHFDLIVDELAAAAEALLPILASLFVRAFVLWEAAEVPRDQRHDERMAVARAVEVFDVLRHPIWKLLVERVLEQLQTLVAGESLVDVDGELGLGRDEFELLHVARCDEHFAVQIEGFDDVLVLHIRQHNQAVTELWLLQNLPQVRPQVDDFVLGAADVRLIFVVKVVDLQHHLEPVELLQDELLRVALADIQPEDPEGHFFHNAVVATCIAEEIGKERKKDKNRTKM